MQLGEYEISEILKRHQRGEGKKAIARYLEISKGTVARYLAMSEKELKAALEGRSLARSSQLDEHRDLIEYGFWSVNGNCVNLQEILESKGIRCNLTTLQWYCRKKLDLRRQLKEAKDQAAKHPNRIETKAGEEMQIDFGEQDVTLGGQQERIHFFLGVLGYSRRIFAMFFTAENQAAWLAGIEGAFMHFGGVPHKIVCDNARALISEARRHGDPPVYTKAFLGLCKYWGTSPEACHAYTPQEKGKVERAVRYVKESFLKDFREFSSLEDMQRKFVVWERERAAWRKMTDAAGMKFIPALRSVEEQEALRPILKEPIAACQVEERVVSASGCISVLNQLFKIREDLRNLTVEVLIGRETIVVSYKGRTVAKLDRKASAYKPMIRPEESFTQGDTAGQPPLPDSPLDRPISSYEEAAAQC